ncbi:aspartate ammonia-lyase [Schaalia sp. lx-260]|uniref:aspartate ammonia-lyase n=1 Tax=Schaalia sp. lx-260 TaxID=2899082 RepID=UPI001E637FD7|nr:aspartate ammonia-lyase [Schaalia sp. lx-260]MCD4549334.1 aspartate ammonia-lyase [Schaalia sp. lx-260]
MDVRIEQDLLGTREVPAEAYWGIHTLRAIENYRISGRSISEVPEMVRAIVQVKKASALANKELRVMESAVADAIVAACDSILDEGRCMDQFPVDQFQGGAGTSVNMNANEVIANLALELMGKSKGEYALIHPNDDVNRSQSTNDAYPTAFRIALHREVKHLRQALSELADAFAAKGQEFADVLTMGRTQLQDAVPMTLGQEMMAFAVTLREEDDRLVNNSDLLLEINLGATAIGTGVNTPPGYQESAVRHLRSITQLPVKGAAHLIEATSDTGAYVSMHATIKRTAVKLSKICNDLRLLASGPRAGLNEINLPEMAAGSSIMPAKVNPVIPEVVNQVCFEVMGNDQTVTMAAEAGQLQLNVMEPVIAQSLFSSLSLLVNACCTLRTRCVEGITANTDVCLGYVTGSIGVVTYFNDVIGHHMGDIVGRRAAAEGRTVREVILEMGLLSETEVDQILSPENLAHPSFRGRVLAPEGEGEE